MNGKASTKFVIPKRFVEVGLARFKSTAMNNIKSVNVFHSFADIFLTMAEETAEPQQ